MRSKEITIDPDAVDPNGIYETATVTGAISIVFDGALVTDSVAYMDYARRIGILSSGNDVGITFTIVGTDADDRAISEVVTGASGATAESALYFKTVFSITSSGAAAANVTIGTVDEFVSNTIPLNHYSEHSPTMSIEGISGTINLSVEQTFSMLQQTDNAFVFSAGHANVTTITADAAADMSNHITGIRFVCNSYTDGASVRLIIHQDGI